MPFSAGASARFFRWSACRACLLVDVTTFIMASAASIAADLLADPQGKLSWKRAGIGAIWIVIAVGTRVFIGRSQKAAAPYVGKHSRSNEREFHGEAPPVAGKWIAMLALLAVSPLLIEPLLRRFLEEGRPLEIQLLLGLRNLGLGLAALCLWPLCARLSAAVSLCVMVFAHGIDENGSLWLFLLFAVAGAGWLWTSYQASVATLIAAATTDSTTSSIKYRAPWRVILTLCLLTASFPLLWIIGPRVPLASLGEWISSSGGTGANDPYARGGVNDGQQEVGGENPETTGFAETDKFLESDKPTLYDTSGDLFGEPIRKKKTQFERMIAISGADVREIKNHAENRQASREFSAARKSPKRPRRRPEDRAARALFEVQGRTPLHLRMDVLADYDGAVWSAAAEASGGKIIESVDRHGRMKLSSPPIAEYYGPPETHLLKIAALDGAISPTPALLASFRVGQIDRKDFFEWRRDGVIGFCGRNSVPAGTTIETQCSAVHFESLDHGDLASSSTSNYLQMPEGSRDRYMGIANQWAGDAPDGRERICRIIERLRSGFRHDRGATVESLQGDPVLEFLTKGSAGPDYLFASSAVLLLRSQGHPARLCLGYYASPDAYDGWTRHTPVREEDIHFWPEILLADGNWLPLESTPGYEVLTPAPSLWQRAADFGFALTKLVARNPLATLAIVLAAFLSVYFHHEFLDQYHLLWQRLLPAADPRQRVLASLQIIERRAALCRQGRREHQTLSDWAAGLAREADSGDELRRFIRLVEAAVYGASNLSADADEFMHRVQKQWSIRRFRRIARKGASGLTALNLAPHSLATESCPC